METTTLATTATLEARPEDVFDILLSSEKHSAATKAESSIENEIGGRFSYSGGGVSGVLLELEPSRRVVQSLRAASWPEGHEARVSYELDPVSEGRRTHIQVLESGVPSAHLDEVVRGWRGYWQAFNDYFSRERVGVVKRFVDEYKNRQNPDIVDDLVDRDCVVHIPLPGLPSGREGMRVNGRLMCGAFPDVHVTREFLVTDGDIVVERALAKATHKGELLGVAPTGNPIAWTELHAYRVRRGVIVEVWSEADFVGILTQVGAVPPLGS